MSENPFLKFVVKDVEFMYPRLDQTYRYNAQKKQSEPCDQTANNAHWSITWKMPLEAAKALREQMVEHYNARRAVEPKLPDFSKIFGAKTIKEEGVVQFAAKKNGTNAEGKLNKEPIVVGPDLQPISDKAIWGGSKGAIRFKAFPSIDPDGVGGISLLLDAVQVKEAVYGDGNLEDDFGPADDGFDSVGEDKPPAAAKAEPSPAAAPKAAEPEDDDEF